MQIEHFIRELLYRYDCVVLPNFGAFLGQRISAQVNTGTNDIYPPTKIISFNQQLTENDGLLIAYIAKAKGLPYESLTDEVLATSDRWTKQLQNGETLQLEGLGHIFLNESGNIGFQPEKKTNYLTETFGFSSVVAKEVVREKLKEKTESLETAVPFNFTPERRSNSGLHPWLKYAAIGLILISGAVTAYQLQQQRLMQQIVVQQQTQEQVSKHIQEATFFDTAPLKLAPISLNVTKKNRKLKKPVHHVVAGAYRIQSNADKKVRDLVAKGYNARYIGINKFGLHQVAFASFSDSKEALIMYRDIKRTISSDVWILSEK